MIIRDPNIIARRLSKIRDRMIKEIEEAENLLRGAPTEILLHADEHWVRDIRYSLGLSNRKSFMGHCFDSITATIHKLEAQELKEAIERDME